ncbi:hypothetical protein CKQ90_32740, partial [Klebsiella pneumoniae]
PGTSICQVNQEVVRIMITGLVRLGILKGEIDELIANKRPPPRTFMQLAEPLAGSGPGTSICQVNQEVVRIMITGLVRLGILKGEIDEL